MNDIEGKLILKVIPKTDYNIVIKNQTCYHQKTCGHTVRELRFLSQIHPFGMNIVWPRPLYAMGPTIELRLDLRPTVEETISMLYIKEKYTQLC